jgi:uncharacterized repeat protein (TIGR01451 family)
MSTDRSDHAATLLPNGKVLVSGGIRVVKNGNFYPTVALTNAETYEPATGTWTTTGSLNTARYSHGATLLPNGKVLVAGGCNTLGTYQSSAELYDVGLGFSSSWQPQISTFTSPLVSGGNLSLTGTLFRGISGASGGNFQDSSSDHPAVQLRSLENGQTVFLNAVNWNTNSFTSTTVSNLPIGWTLVTMFVNGINSTSRILSLVSPPQIISQPIDQLVNKGDNATFSVAAVGTMPLRYQWKFNGSAIPGATNATLTLTNLQLTQTGHYQVTVSDSYGSAVSSNATLTVYVIADIAVLLSGPPVATQGSNFVYTITVTNLGPSTASNVVASDILPAGLNFVSASSGGKATNGIVTWPKVSSLAVGSVINYTLTVNAPLTGRFTNSASAVATTYDPNPTNNSGVVIAAEVDVVPFGILRGAPVLNPQTGLYEEIVTVTNNTDLLIYGFRLYVGGLPSGVTLYNASGITNGVPYVNYKYPVDPKTYVSMILEFYNSMRLPFTNTLYAEALPLNQVVPPGNVSTNGSALITSTFLDNRIAGDPRFVIVFKSVPGKTYVVIYKDNSSTNWHAATPSIKASANITQWYDDGPPETQCNPMSVTNRFYRVIQY